MLTDRQLAILSCIISYPEGIKSAELAKHIGISIRTLQAEIQLINDNLPNHQRIKSHPRWGHYAEGFNVESKNEIADILRNRHTRKAPLDRVNTILSILAFEHDYISMEKLADKIYVSKASVFKEFENSKILRTYVEVSKQKGLRIQGDESAIRDLLARCFDKDMAVYYDPDLKGEYEQLNHILRSILPDLFVQHRYFVSGEALRSFRRYLIITILRNKRGYILEHGGTSRSCSALMLEIVERINHLTGVFFSEDDTTDCQKKLNGLNSFTDDIPRRWAEKLPQYEAMLTGFVNELNVVFGIDLEFSQEDRNHFLLYVMKMYERNKAHHNNSNYQKRAIHSRYPMSAHLIWECFRRYFPDGIPETEVSNLALFLAAKLDKNPCRPECMIISDQPPSILYHMKANLEERYGYLLADVHIVQDYRYQASPISLNDKIVLTTEETTVLVVQNAILVNPLLSEKDYREIESRIKEQASQMHENAFREALKKFEAEPPQYCQRRFKDLKEFLENTGEEKPDDAYEFVLDLNAILFPRIHYNDTPNRIKVYILKHPVLYRRTSLRMIVFSDYQAGSKQMPVFYNCIRMMLKEEYIQKLERIYL